MERRASARLSTQKAGEAMIDPKVIQTFLKTEGYYGGTIDGIFGPQSYAASRQALTTAHVAASAWSNSRVYIAVEQLFLNRVISAGLVVDGLDGPHTEDAIYTYTAGQL